MLKNIARNGKMIEDLLMRIIFLCIIIFLNPKIVSAGWFDNLFGSGYYYNVLLYTPANKELFLGTAKTLSDCQTMAFR